MMQQKKPVLFILLFSGCILLLFLLMQPAEVRYGWGEIAVLFPKGKIAIKQRNLLFIIQAVMLLIVIPVYVLTFIFSWKYRADNPHGKYTPDWDDNRLAEYIWWGVPCVLTILVGVITLIRTYQLDPFRPIPSEKPTLRVQVVALQWKWLFIYPEEKIALVNFLQFPEKTPVRFEITADAPMNSFWIPQLGGQIYAMPKMKTQLHLIADQTGEFRGSSANLSGVGFAGMHFIAKASSDEEYLNWVQEVKSGAKSLNFENYAELAKPSENSPVMRFTLEDDDLFEKIVMKYMHPQEKKE